MRVIDVGRGQPIVLIPGIQGRWEWLRPTVDALASRFRVITGSLPGEPGSLPLEDERDFAALVKHVDALMDGAAVKTATICGISFGGLVALRYAATRPDRVRALVLVSSPGPKWTPAAHQARYMRSPLLTFPMFLFGAARRVSSELRATFPVRRDRFDFCRRWTVQILKAPGIPWRMGARARMAAAEQFDDDCGRIGVPTLVIAGEDALDKVVSPADTMSYVSSIAGAQFQLLRSTGHLGVVTCPDRFADLVSRFLNTVP